MEKEKDKGKKLQELCSALYTVKRECSEQEQSLKQLKKRKEDLVKDIIPIMKDLKIKQVSYDTAKFSYSSKEVIHFPSKDNLMARESLYRVSIKVIRSRWSYIFGVYKLQHFGQD